MPDWKDDAAYGFTGKLDQAGWAWEFLRRNEQYHADWERYAREGWESWGEDPQMFYSYIANTYGVSSLQDPAEDKPGFIFGIPRHVNNQLIGYQTSKYQFIEGQGGPSIYTAKGQWVTIPQGQVAVTFDMERPLDPQIKFIKKILKENQKLRKKKRPTLHRDNWTIYLRVLDARSVKASYNVITSVLYEVTGDIQLECDYTGRHKVRDIYKNQALPLVQGGYLEILSS